MPGIFSGAIKAELRDNDRARTEGESEGFLKLVPGKKGRIIGAAMVGNRAGEIIPLASAKKSFKPWMKSIVKAVQLR